MSDTGGTNKRGDAAMYENLHETDDVEEATTRALNTHVGDDEVSDSTIAVTAVHVPGAALERTADAESSRALEAELAVLAEADTAAPLPVEYDGIDTRTPEGNLASRSNIVRD